YARSCSLADCNARVVPMWPRKAKQSAGDVLRAMVEMFDTGNTAGLDDVVDPQYLDHQGLGGTPIFGADGFARVVDAARAGYEQLEVRIADLIEDADRAAARVTWHGLRTSGE